jgi:hypothetical protein
VKQKRVPPKGGQGAGLKFHQRAFHDPVNMRVKNGENYLNGVVFHQIDRFYMTDGEALVLNGHIFAEARSRVKISLKIVITGKPSLASAEHKNHTYKDTQGEDEKNANYLVGKADR